MRIIKRQEFLALPAGTLFTKFEPNITGPVPDGMCVKGDTLPTSADDFFFTRIFNGVCHEANAKHNGDLGFSVNQVPFVPEFPSHGERDGCFDDENNTFFVIWEKDDIVRLTDYLLGLFKGL